MKREPGFNILHLMILMLLAAGVYFLAAPWLPGRGDDIFKSSCVSHLKQLGTGMSIYTDDFDGRFPPRTWHDELLKYVKDPDLFTCPEIKRMKKANGYAMVKGLLGKDSSSLPMRPELTPMLFEIDVLGKDSVADVTARSRTRHSWRNDPGGAVICNADTSVKFFYEGEPLRKP